MRERAQTIGGTVDWTTPPSGGCRVHLAVAAVARGRASRAGVARCGSSWPTTTRCSATGSGSLLEAWGHEVVGRASNGVEAVDLVLRLAPDLVLMDVRMPGKSGVEATREIAAARPDTPIVMLTVSEDEDDLFAAIQAGARGYLLKNLEAAQLRAMIETVARGEAAITPATAARIIRHLSSLAPARRSRRRTG